MYVLAILWCWYSVADATIVFAPIALLMPYNTVDEAIEIANGTRYGLGASVFGPDQKECLEVAKELECGMVSINDFGVFYVSLPLPDIQIIHSERHPDKVRDEIFMQRSSSLTFFHSQDLPFGGTKYSGYGRFGQCFSTVAV